MFEKENVILKAGNSENITDKILTPMKTVKASTMGFLKNEKFFPRIILNKSS
jgi:hypothetical protein